MIFVRLFLCLRRLCCRLELVLDLDDLHLLLLLLLPQTLDLVLHPLAEPYISTALNRMDEVTDISDSMNSNRLSTFMVASDLSCFNNTGPINL